MQLTMRDVAGPIKRRAMNEYNLVRHPYNAIRRTAQARSAQRRVFIDCGANNCGVLREFIQRYPGFEFFAFEAQPELAGEGERFARELPNVKIQYFNKAVWTQNGEMSFYLATKWDTYHRAGSTLVKGHTKNGAEVDYNSAIKVEAIDFSSWLSENFSPDDYLIVKMDIEGAEYDVLDKVIADGNLALIDELMVEFHQHMNETIPKTRHDALIKTLRRSCLLKIWH